MTLPYGGTVSVIDAATRAVTATIPVGIYPAGVAVDPAARTVYVANAGAGTVSVIDEATSTVTATIPVGSQPDGVAVDPTTHTVYVANYSDGTVSVIDAATRAVTATIPVGSQPYGVAVDPAAGTVYVTNDGDGTVSVIDAATRAVTATIPVGSEPDGVAVDPATHTAYVTNEGDGTVSVISAPLAAPSGLAAKLAGPVSGPPSGVALTWTDNATDPAATRVRVQRASDPGFTTGLADFPLGAAATSYTDTAVTEGATYYYRVRAENEASNSAWSSTVSVVYTTVPAAPAGLTATLAGSSVSLTWTAPAGTAPATRLRIQRATDPGFTSGVTGILAGPAATSYTDNGVTQGTTYYYRVRAENKASNSAWSNTASILVPRPVPAAPANLTARAYPSGFGQASIDLTWTENRPRQSQGSPSRPRPIPHSPPESRPPRPARRPGNTPWPDCAAAPATTSGSNRSTGPPPPGGQPPWSPHPDDPAPPRGQAEAGPRTAGGYRDGGLRRLHAAQDARIAVPGASVRKHPDEGRAAAPLGGGRRHRSAD